MSYFLCKSLTWIFRADFKTNKFCWILVVIDLRFLFKYCVIECNGLMIDCDWNWRDHTEKQLISFDSMKIKNVDSNYIKFYSSNIFCVFFLLHIKVKCEWVWGFVTPSQQLSIHRNRSWILRCNENFTKSSGKRCYKSTFQA